MRCSVVKRKSTRQSSKAKRNRPHGRARNAPATTTRPFPEPFRSLEEFLPGADRRARLCAVTVKGLEKAEILIGLRLSLMQPGVWLTPKSGGHSVNLDSGLIVDEDYVRVAI